MGNSGKEVRYSHENEDRENIKGTLFRYPAHIEQAYPRAETIAENGSFISGK
jgi:hypothetical protein